MEARVLGDYHLIKPIGQGTLGAVYLAEHRFMKRQYVLKVLPEELTGDRGFIQRFEEEIGILSSLDHPNLVKIHNISFAQGNYFLVTDCIVDELGETTNLAQYISKLGRALGEEEIFQILKRVADALDYAHSKKIGHKALAHRNLKLNNILIGKGRSVLDIYLSDFGLSRIIGPGAILTRTYKYVAEALSINTTSLGREQDSYPVPPIEVQKLLPLHISFLQNYSFLAPEQKRLDTSHPVDNKADAYAFGVLAYFLLMQELPEGIFEMPSVNRKCHYQWDTLLQACLQNYPARRPDQLLPLLLSIQPKEKIKETPVISEKSKEPILEKIKEVPIVPIIDEGPPLVEKILVPLENKPVKSDSLETVVKVVLDETISQSVSHLKPIFHVPQLERPRSDLNPAAALQVDSSVKVYHPELKDVANIKPLLTDMIVIRGGDFSRGSQDGNRDEMPRHRIVLADFAIDIHPVTNEQFVRFLDVMGGEKDSQHNDIIRLRDSRIKRSGGKLSIESGYAKHPVVGVTWYGAIAYAKWVGKRLPTEAEWEISAYGGSENALYPTGDDIEKTQANFFSSDTTAVMSYAPNVYGLYDIVGNVYEWCHDWYGYNYYEISVQEPENPQGPLQGVYRVLRGGCWKSLKEDLRCSRRHRNNPGTVNSTYGFRCAADVQFS